jgi:predicted ferric reductase
METMQEQTIPPAAAKATVRAPENDIDNLPPAMALHTLLLMLLAVVVGAFAAVVVLPTWLPALSESLLGPEPKAYWYLSRTSAFVAYALLWLSMALGLLMTNKMARIWPGGPAAFDVHQHASLLGLAFALFHALILTGDAFIGYTPAQVLTPFASDNYEPFWVGLGQVGFYLLALVGLSFYVRKFIGRQIWRLIHFLSFVVFGLALVHGVWSGTDSNTTWAQAIYWFSGGSLLFLTIYRVLVSRQSKTKSARQPAA